jgi:hypothetical protein
MSELGLTARVDEIVAECREIFPNTRIPEHTLRTIARRAAMDEAPPLKKVRKVCVDCGHKWEGSTFSIKRVVEEPLRTVCDNCVRRQREELLERVKPVRPEVQPPDALELELADPVGDDELL